MIIFENSAAGRVATGQFPKEVARADDIPESLLRRNKPRLPESSEMDVVRHFSSLSKKNFGIDTHFYPLGSCTMKYNPRGVHAAAMLPGFLHQHPFTDSTQSQGVMHAFYELQNYLCDVTGMHAVSLTPMAGSQGEFAGVAMIRAYHEANQDFGRTEILVPDSAHGTNPASAVICGFQVKEVPTKSSGDLDLDELRQAVGPQTAGIMLTNPSTIGVFEREIKEVAAIVHGAGGLLYCDGANFNATLGRVRPGDMGFDVMHLNLHKTFATPHGGGGPGSGPVAVAKRLAPFLPTPIVGKTADGYVWLGKNECPQTMGRMSAFMGNGGILLRAYWYIRMLGRQGLRRVSEYAVLNANYMMAQLAKEGFTLAFPKRRASHEFIVTLSNEKKAFGVTARDFAKRLLDYGFHAPTTYFPLTVPECLLIEPTETESKETLDRFIAALAAIRREAEANPETLREAPTTTPVRRLDDVKAAREPNLVWKPGDDQSSS